MTTPKLAHFESTSMILERSACVRKQSELVITSSLRRLDSTRNVLRMVRRQDAAVHTFDTRGEDD